jgi:hypothetical protein
MNKKSVPRSAAPAKAFPLKDLRITWYRPAHFSGEKGKVPVTITGGELAKLLAWLSRANPGATVRAVNLERFGDVSLEVEGLAQVFQALSESSPSEMQPCPIFWTLSQYASDLAARMQAAEDGEGLLAEARVAVTS